MSQKNFLILKWGTWKEYNFIDNDAAQKLMLRYKEIGSEISGMAQNDTPEQKELLCQMIDLMPGEIYLDWDGKYVSKKEAKKYVMNYRKE